MKISEKDLCEKTDQLFKEIHDLKLERLLLTTIGNSISNGFSFNDINMPLLDRNKFFDMFDRVILTSDDPNLDKERLTSKGYDLRHISYGNDKDVLGEIIRHRKPLYEDNETYKELFTTDLFLDKLINFNGNIDLSLEALGYVRELLSWYDRNNHSIEKVLDEAIEEKKNYSKKLEKVISKPTLYL